MALISPGVQVSVIDESQYISAATNSVPLIVVATAQNKSVPNGQEVAPGSVGGQIDTAYLITSQRDLVNTFGVPFFYKTSAGTPIHGYELNEYGLLAAYSVLGVSNRAYVIRADIDLSELTARLSRPTGEPSDGLYWLDTTETRWGIFEWNKDSGLFVNRVPLVISDSSQLSAGVPIAALGSQGSYAVVTTSTENPIYFKNSDNEWVLVGSAEWVTSHPMIRGAVVSPVLTGTGVIKIDDVFVSLDGGTTLGALVSAINSAAIPGLTAAAVRDRLEVRLDAEAHGKDYVDLDLALGSADVWAEAGVEVRRHYAPKFQHAPHTQVPRWRDERPTGSVWIKTTNANQGFSIAVKRYNTTVSQFAEFPALAFESDAAANRAFDPAGGGLAIPARTLYAQYDVEDNQTATIQLFERFRSGPTVISGLNTDPEFAPTDAFNVYVSIRGADHLSGPYDVTVNGTTALDFAAAVSNAAIPNLEVRVTAIGTVEFKHTQGGVIVLEPTAGNPFGVDGVNLTSAITGVRDGNAPGRMVLSNWIPLQYVAGEQTPDNKPVDGRLWYYSAVNEVDVLINDNGGWKSYRTVTNDIRGFNLTATDPKGPLVAAVPPSEQSNGAALALGDIWVDTSDLENYPNIYRWEEVDGARQWVRIDNTDQTSQSGIVFADARWSANGDLDPINDPIPTIESLLNAQSSVVDPDCPSYTLYPEGTLLFNTRRSGFNVKRFARNYFTAARFPDADLTGRARDTWITASGLRDDGSPYMGRKAVRAMVVAAMKSAVDTNAAIREEQRAFNLLAAPGYPELIPNLVALNNERKQTGFVVGDAPLRLDDSGNSILSWTNDGGQDNLTSGDPYAAVFYPACRTNDLSGSPVVQPASHMMLRTIIRSDSIAYPWLAPAGTRRGLVDNAQSLGYIDAATGEFVEVNNRERVRDVLYENRVNPITFIPGAGITNYGNKTLYEGSALDRINVARLVAYARGRLEAIGRLYLFEPNDPLTRNELKGQVEQLMQELVAKRAIYDYLVVCDESNNTPARIDRNELWVDIAIEPVKAIEFVYIPLRIKNTGEIGS